MLSAIAPSFGILIFFRFLVGVGLGGVAVAFTYVTEFIPSKQRGVVGTFIQGWWTVGTFIQVTLAWSSFQTLGWRWVVGLSTIPIFIMVLLFGFLPESPRFLALQGKQEQVRALFKRAARQNGTIDQLPANFQVKTTQSGDSTQTVMASFKEAFSIDFRRDTLLLLIIWFANAMTYYGLVLLTTELALMRQDVDVSSNNNTLFLSPSSATSSGGSGGISPSSQQQQQQQQQQQCGTIFNDAFFTEIMIATIAEMPGLLAGICLVDSLGRKKTQTLFFAVVTGALLLLAAIPRSAGGDTVVLFIARGASMGAFAIVFLYTPERYPTRFRNTAMGMCFGFARIGGMISPLVAQDLPQRGFLGVAFGIMVTVALIACVSTALLSQDTTGKELDRPTGRIEVDTGVGFARLHRSGSDAEI